MIKFNNNQLKAFPFFTKEKGVLFDVFIMDLEKKYENNMLIVL